MIELRKVKVEEINELSKLATKIVKEHYDPIIGEETNAYMLNLFQTPEGLKKQMDDGYDFFWAILDDVKVGYFAFKPKEGRMYLSKLYIDKEYRGRKIASTIFDYLVKTTKSQNMTKIFLNVNKHNDDTLAIYKHLGFVKIKAEVNPIGHGYYMDDYVLEYTI